MKGCEEGALSENWKELNCNPAELPRGAGFGYARCILCSTPSCTMPNSSCEKSAWAWWSVRFRCEMNFFPEDEGR